MKISAPDQSTSVASKVIFAFSSSETGQPALALPANSSKFRLVRARHLAFQGQVHGSNGEAVGHFFERDFGRGLHALGGELGLAENERESLVKQPACAAPMSSSGLVPGLPSKRLLKPYG
jgi:hypothetical protein